MTYNQKKNQINPEYTMVNLFIILFYISLIQSFRLLSVTALFIIGFILIIYRNKSFYKLIKPVLPFVILLNLPLILRYLIGGTISDLDFTMMITGKILLSSIILSAVVSKHSALYLVDGIIGIGLPETFNKILALTFRYFYMINHDVQIGRRALTSRGLNERKGLSSLSVFGEWIGGFLLKSSNHGEMVFNAMKSRGFQGQSSNREVQNKKLLIRAFILSLILILILIIDGRL